MITKENLKKYASKLMFDMNDNEYEVLMQEFDVILDQMELIGKIENISDVEPMTFPYIIKRDVLREDEATNLMTTEELLSNVKEVERNQIKVPKVVEE